jgi:hypothetical protein
MMGEESGARQCGSHSYTARKAYSLSGPNAPTGTCSLTHGKGKAVPLQAWSDLEGSRKLRFPDFMTTAQDGGMVVSLTHRPPLPPGNAPGTYFC